ncbi:MAG: hypothetical protein ACYST2_04700, partial [Planctomycetota bacterium]
SPFYKFTNGLGVGDSEQKIKQAFGDDFHLEEAEWKDFIAYRDKGLVFEIHKDNRTVMEINVLPREPKPVSLERFRDGFFEKHDSFDIDSATLSDVKKIFGEPKEYVWGNQTLDREDLPRRFVIIYPDSFCVLMAEDKVVELRHEGPETEYAWKGKIRVGDSIDHVMEVVGEPTQIVTGQENRFKDKVLYKDIAGRQGHCYYARHDQDVRFWFADYKVVAIYITRSDYDDGS